MNSKFDQDSLFFPCLQSLCSSLSIDYGHRLCIDSWSALRHNARVVTFRQGILQRLKSNSSCLAIWQGLGLLGLIARWVSDLSPCTLPPCSIHAPSQVTLLPTRQNSGGADTTPRSCESSHTGFKNKPSAWWYCTAMQQETSAAATGWFGPSAEALRWTNNTWRHQKGGGSGRRVRPQVSSALGTAHAALRRAGVPDLMIYLWLLLKESRQATVLPVLQSSVRNLPTTPHAWLCVAIFSPLYMGDVAGLGGKTDGFEAFHSGNPSLVWKI